jgi:hypothetical protein
MLGFDDPERNGQFKAGSTGAAVARGLASMKRGEDGMALGYRNAWRAIFNDYFYCFSCSVN